DPTISHAVGCEERSGSAAAGGGPAPACRAVTHGSWLVEGIDDCPRQSPILAPFRKNWNEVSSSPGSSSDRSTVKATRIGDADEAATSDPSGFSTEMLIC